MDRFELIVDVHTYVRTYVCTYVRTYVRTHVRTYGRTDGRTYGRTYVGGDCTVSKYSIKMFIFRILCQDVFFEMAVK